MKKNTQRLLFALYDPEKAIQHLGYSYEFLNSLFPEHSQGGIRAQIKLLFDQGFIHKTEIDGKIQFSLTAVGKNIVRRKYPITVSQKGIRTKNNYLLVLGKSTNADQGFQKLVMRIKEEKGSRLGRGVYLFRERPSQQFTEYLLLKYNNNCYFLEVVDSVIGNIDSHKINEKNALNNHLSGLSKQVSELTDTFLSKKTLIERDKNNFYSLFIQAEDIFAEFSVKGTTANEQVEAFIDIFTHLKRVFLEKMR